MNPYQNPLVPRVGIPINLVISGSSESSLDLLEKISNLGYQQAFSLGLHLGFSFKKHFSFNFSPVTQTYSFNTVSWMVKSINETDS